MLTLITALWLGLVPAHAGNVQVYSGSGTDIKLEKRTTEYYVVQRGDTLWEISSKFLGNPYYWPRLWSINDYITNPHWIYPGNRIVFQMGTLIEPPRVELDAPRDGYVIDDMNYEDIEAECGADVRFDGKLIADRYFAPTFLGKKRDVEVFGTVEKAKSGQTFLSERNMLYLQLDDPDAYECGDIVAIFRPIKKRIRHPKIRRRKYGHLYQVVAEAKVTHRYGDYISAVVRQAWAEVKRGDLVGPNMPLTVEIEVDKPTGDLEGTIVERGTPGSNLTGLGESVFLDRGRADGVRVGDAFYVVQRRDENLDYRKEDKDLPASVIGRVVVVRVDDYSSTAVVVDASRSIRAGNRITTQVN